MYPFDDRDEEVTRRERRWVRWTLLGATVVLGLDWIVNLNHLEARHAGSYWIGFGLGGVLIARDRDLSSRPWTTDPPWWLPHHRSWPNGAWFQFIPIWTAVGPLALATALAFLQDRRSERAGLCGECGYDRAGLEAAAVCPECGDVPGGA